MEISKRASLGLGGALSLAIGLMGLMGGPAGLFGQQSLAQRVGPEGGSVEFASIGAVSVPAGALSEPSEVKLALATNPRALAAFREFCELFSSCSESPLEIHLSLGKEAPRSDEVQVQLKFPSSLFAGKSGNRKPSLFGFSVHGGAQEQLETIEGITSRYDAGRGLVIAEIPRGYFLQQSKLAAEAILFLAASEPSSLRPR